MKEDFMEKTYFEVRGEELLRTLGITKTDFAEQMGIKKQNVKALFATKNIVILRQAAKVMGVPLEQLIAPADVIPEAEINGFVEVNREIYRIRDKEDLYNVIAKIGEVEAAMNPKE